MTAQKCAAPSSSACRSLAAGAVVAQRFALRIAYFYDERQAAPVFCGVVLPASGLSFNWAASLPVALCGRAAHHHLV